MNKLKQDRERLKEEISTLENKRKNSRKYEKQITIFENNFQQKSESIQSLQTKFEVIDTSNPQNKILIDFYTTEMQVLNGWKDEIHSKINILREKVTLTEENFLQQKDHLENELSKIKLAMKKLKGK